MLVSSSIFTVTNSSLLLLAHSGNAFAIQGAAQNPIQPGIDGKNSGSQPTTEKLSLPDGYTAEAVVWNHASNECHFRCKWLNVYRGIGLYLWRDETSAKNSKSGSEW
jgi:hypothetical protein